MLAIKIKSIVMAIAVAFSVAVVPAVPAFAAPAAGSAADMIGTGAGSVTDPASKKNSFEDIVKNVVNILLFLIGAISVIMIIIGGIRYATSGGDSNGTKAAKDTILYAVIGVALAVFAYAIVNWAIKSFSA